jgi:hypothetical protein
MPSTKPSVAPVWWDCRPARSRSGILFSDVQWTVRAKAIGISHGHRLVRIDETTEQFPLRVFWYAAWKWERELLATIRHRTEDRSEHVFSRTVCIFAMLGGSRVTTAWRVLRLRMLGGSLVTTAWRVLRLRMLGGSLVTTAWRVLRLRMEETASRYGG